LKKKVGVEAPTESLERGRLSTKADERHAPAQRGGGALSHMNCK
jgi:hypothetical protein